MWRVLLYFFVAALAGLLLEVGDFQDVTSSGKVTGPCSSMISGFPT
jgi:hypothetical protein